MSKVSGREWKGGRYEGGGGKREEVKGGEDALYYTINTLLSYTNSFHKHN